MKKLQNLETQISERFQSENIADTHAASNLSMKKIAVYVVTCMYWIIIIALLLLMIKHSFCKYWLDAAVCAIYAALLLVLIPVFKK